METSGQDKNELDQLNEYLNSYSSSTYLAEFIEQSKIMDQMEPDDKTFYFNQVIKQILVNAMLEYEHCKAELDSLLWRYKFSCHPSEEIMVKKEIERVKDNLKDLEKLFLMARKYQPPT